MPRKVIAGIFALLVCGLAAFILWPDSPQQKLEKVRGHANTILESSGQKQKRIAKQCADGATALFDEPDATGTTAMLFYMAVFPLADADPSLVEVPSVEKTEAVKTEDLLLVTQLLLRTQRLGPADQIVTLALRRDDQRKETLRLAIDIRLELGRDAEVMQHTEELVLLAPDDPHPYRVQTTVHRNHGRWDHLVISAEKAVERTSPTDWVLQIELIDGYTQLGRTKEARREFDKVKQARPDLVRQAPIVHARLLLQEGEVAQARQMIEQFLAVAPQDTEGLLMYGKLQTAQEEYEPAISTFQRIISIDPSESEAYYQLGQAYARTGNVERSREYSSKHRELLDAKVRLYQLEQQAAREPYNKQVRLELARSYEKIGLDELAKFWTRAAEHLTDP